MTSENKAVVQRLIEGMDSGDFGVFDTLCSPSYKCYFAGIPKPESREQHRETAQSFYAAFPDMRHEIHDLIEEDDKVVLRATPGGTHRGEFMGISPTEKRVEFSVMALFRIANSKIEEEWVLADMMGLRNQLTNT